jgi:hypothetical protein
MAAIVHFLELLVTEAEQELISQGLRKDAIGRIIGSTRAIVLRNADLITSIAYCRLNPKADATLTVKSLVYAFSDNDLGVCPLSIKRIAEILKRSGQCISDCLDRLTEHHFVWIKRGRGSSVTTGAIIPSFAAVPNTSVAWIADALSRASAHGRPRKNVPKSSWELSPENVPKSSREVFEKSSQEQSKKFPRAAPTTLSFSTSFTEGGAPTTKAGEDARGKVAPPGPPGNNQKLQSSGFNGRWATDAAKMAASIDPAEAKAQQQVCLNDFGGIEIAADFRQWLLDNGSTPTGIRDGLSRASGKVTAKSPAVYIRGKVIEYCSYAENEAKRRPKSGSRTL